MADKPLLLLDVDGPLNVFDGRKSLPEGFVKHRAAPHGDHTPYDVYLNAAMGPRLLEFAEKHDVELVWATTWEHHANVWIGPKIGLPILPVIKFGYSGFAWKFKAVAEYAGARPLAWFDDDFAYYETLRKEHFDGPRDGIPTLLRHIDPTVGITETDLRDVGHWFDQLRVGA